MKIAILLILIVNLFGRENPFAPVLKPKSITNNMIKEQEYLKKEKVYLPSTARILKNVIFEYQNIDGTISKESLAINKKIDWHNPIEVIQRGNEKKGSGLFGYFFEELKLKGITRIKAKYAKDAIFLTTKDKKIRDLMVTKPYRIVIDF